MLKTMNDVERELKKKSKGKFSINPSISLTEEEKRLVQWIDEQTKNRNKNNVTRTAAYLQFYSNYPEIHWAFLGHMVSRNGGWNMTDLKGGLLPHLLSQEEQEAFFSFLERGNWLIFQDIYPQFLLYEASINRGKNMFYLLSTLNVSTFMATMWNYFWNSRDAYSLAIALIINEQAYLEKRVIQNDHFKKAVLNTVGFKLYDFCRFNHILFPYDGDDPFKASLIGETSTHFTSLHDRIMLGKRLYPLLFQDKEILSKTFQWAKGHPHTGSRKDYWPHLFNNVNEASPRSLYKRRIKNCEIIKGGNRIYSPPLVYAWDNVDHLKAEEGDWFEDWHCVDYITKYKVNPDGNIQNAYCQTLETIELTILTKSALPWDDESK